MVIDLIEQNLAEFLIAFISALDGLFSAQIKTILTTGAELQPYQQDRVERNFSFYCTLFGLLSATLILLVHVATLPRSPSGGQYVPLIGLCVLVVMSCVVGGRGAEKFGDWPAVPALAFKFTPLVVAAYLAYQKQAATSALEIAL